jgi:hypothetical protein
MLKERGLSCTLFRDDYETFDFKDAEKKISTSTTMIAILSAGALETKEIIFALQAASFHFKEISRIILVSKNPDQTLM